MTGHPDDPQGSGGLFRQEHPAAAAGLPRTISWNEDPSMMSPSDDPEAGRLARVADAITTQQQSGACRRPILLTGTRLLVEADSGRVVHRMTAADLPHGVVTVRCGSRRARVCPSCSTLYRFDTYQLIAAGLRGGKNVPAGVGAHARLFVTLTAPSFGPVHLGPDRYGTPRPCHTRGLVTCGRFHVAGDALIGHPVDPEGYDYVGQVLFNAHAGRLWARFTIETSRALAVHAGLSRRAARAVVRVAFAKVVEFQARGVVHVHALVRLDGHRPASTPPAWATGSLLRKAVADVTVRTRVSTPDCREVPSRTVAWGQQIDIRTIAAADGDISDAAVARYVAKYATKSVETAGVLLGPIWCRACTGRGHSRISLPGCAASVLVCRRCRGTGRRHGVDLAGLSAHVAALVGTCWRLGGVPDLAHLKLRRWAHMLGYCGHVTTKSRTWSTTLADLRAERQDWIAAQRDNASRPGSGSLVVVDDWRYSGRGPAGKVGGGGHV